MPREIDGKTFYLIKETYEMAGIGRDTLFRWIRDGKIEDAKLRNRNGWRLFSEEEVKKLLTVAHKTTRMK